eukprot:365787-Chlamydomonas_euryale.AAC.7
MGMLHVGSAQPQCGGVDQKRVSSVARSVVVLCALAGQGAGKQAGEQAGGQAGGQAGRHAHGFTYMQTDANGYVCM